MRVTQTLIPTLREVPAEADTISHQLLLRAGMLRKVAAGVYTLLPLGYRVIQKIERIVREEMNRAGGVELLLPIMQPAELWRESGRWDVYGPEMFKLNDRHERSFCLGPTHEEVVTDLARQELRSYRQLPLLVYQIQNKYRDERRPRFGLLRGREFIMKDLYSFDKDYEGLEASYHKMYQAYWRIFTRCGLDFRVVEADPGAIGGGDTHEFMVLADTGEAEIVFCSSCDYAADIEKAPCLPDLSEEVPAQKPLELVATPGMKTVQDVAGLLGVSMKQVLKTLIYQADDQLVVVLLRGDRNVNEVKVQNFLGCARLEIAPEEKIAAELGVPCGFLGPVRLQEKGKVRVLADEEVRSLTDAVAGANQQDYHFRHVCYGRDFDVDAFGDFRVTVAGEPCPRCHSPLKLLRGIEVGQIFKLGTKYSQALGATILNEEGQEVPIVMGCYGIGVTRTMAAAVEQKHDADGILWPVDIAPYEVVLIQINAHDQLQLQVAGEVYQELLQAGIDVIYDDRNERPGVKFKDADLIGYPCRLVVGKQARDGKIEVKWRTDRETMVQERQELIPYLKQTLEGMRSRI